MKDLQQTGSAPAIPVEEQRKVHRALVDIMDVSMRISATESMSNKRDRDRAAQPLWIKLYSMIDAFLWRWGVPASGSINDYVFLPFEDWVRDVSMIRHMDLRSVTIMIDERMNHGQFRQYCPDQEEGSLFTEIRGLSKRAGSQFRTGDAGQVFYTNVRAFLTRNPTASSVALEEFVQDLSQQLSIFGQPMPEDLRQATQNLLQKIYLTIGTSAAPSFQHVCSHCSSPAPTARNGKPECSGSPWHTHVAEHGVQSRLKDHDRVLAPRLLCDITGPGRAEVDLHEAILALGLEAELFPKLDDCDVGFELHGRPYHVDLKCWTLPGELKKKILKSGLPSRIENVSKDTFYVVIPDAIARRPEYLDDLRYLLGKEAKTHGFLHLDHIMSHSDFLALIKDAL